MDTLANIVKCLMDTTLQSSTKLPSESLPETQIQAINSTEKGTLCFPWQNEPGLWKITDEEKNDWNKNRALNLVWQILKAIPHGIERIVCRPTPKVLSDSEFLSFINTSALCVLCRPITN